LNKSPFKKTGGLDFPQFNPFKNATKTGGFEMILNPAFVFKIFKLNFNCKHFPCICKFVSLNYF